MQALAKIKYAGKSDAEAFVELEGLVLRAGGPVATGTRPATGGIYSKLTDASLYTGAHKASLVFPP